MGTLKLFSIVIGAWLFHQPLFAFTGYWSDKGAYSYTWYDKSQSDLYIETAEQLAGVAYLVNNNFTSFKGQTIHLSNDINLYGRYWTPIGISNTKFQGNFNGHGYSIDGLRIPGHESMAGFWTTLENVTVENIHITYCETISSSVIHYLGVIACQATNCTFSNIRSTYADYSTKEDVSGGTNSTFKFYKGGVVGLSSNCRYEYINSAHVVEFIFGEASGSNCYGRIEAYIGGIVGKGEKDSFYKCETSADYRRFIIYGYVTSNSYTTHGASSICVGGIAGYESGSGNSIVSCLSRTGFYGGFLCGTYDSVSFYYGGIIGKNFQSTIENCVAITDRYKIEGHGYTWVASWYHTNSTFGGITTTMPDKFGGCYSNNDVITDVSKVEYDRIGENGSTSFSSSEMDTQSFLDEVNFYSRLQYGTNNWCIDDSGHLAISYEDEPNFISSVEADNKKSIIEIYNINGLRISYLQPGINIVRLSDGSFKKIYGK